MCRHMVCYASSSCVMYADDDFERVNRRAICRGKVPGFWSFRGSRKLQFWDSVLRSLVLVAQVEKPVETKMPKY